MALKHGYTSAAKIELTPKELCYAFSKRFAALARPEPRPFDKELVLSDLRLPKHFTEIAESSIDDFKHGRLWTKAEAKLRFTVPLAKELARLNYHLQSHGAGKIQSIDHEYQQLKVKLESASIANCLQSSPKFLLNELNQKSLALAAIPPKFVHSVESHFELAIPLLFLFPFHDFVAVWEECWSVQPDKGSGTRRDVEFIFSAIQEAIVPYITEDELVELRKYLQTVIQHAPYNITKATEEIPLPYLIAGMFGMTDLVELVVSSIPDDVYTRVTGPDQGLGGLARPDLLLFGLNDAEVIYRHFARTGLSLWSPSQCLAWLANFGTKRIEPVAAFANRHGRACMTQKHQWRCAGQYLNPLFRVKTSEAAREIFFLSTEPAFRAKCHTWLRKHPEVCLEALLDLARSNGNRVDEVRLAEGAKLFIRDMLGGIKENSVSANLLQACLELTEDCVASSPIGSSNRPAWLSELFASYKLSQVSLPPWLSGAILQPILIEEYRLSAEEIRTLLYALKSSKDDNIHPLLLALRTATHRSVFDKFVWDIFERWTTELAPPKERWCMLAVGILGSDATIAKLVPLMKDWRASGNPTRAVYGLECIKAAGSDASVVIIQQISQSSSLKSLRNRAESIINKIASIRGLSPMQLEDITVPTCGLDKSGEGVFDYGGRQFRFVLSTNLSANIKDGSGLLREDLPAPNRGDDRAIAATAQAEWKTLKRLIKSTANIQARRLEKAMIGGRTWAAKDFDLCFVQHPLMWHLCKPLIWSVYDSGGKLGSTFRITEERDYSDVREKTFVLSNNMQVGVVHPFELYETEIAAWEKVLVGYELVPPFPQLRRKFQSPPAADIKGNEFAVIRNIELEAVYIPSLLEKRDWERMDAQDSGLYFGHFKYFSGKDLTALITYTGIYSGDPKMSVVQHIDRVGFACGYHNDASSYYGLGGSGLTFDKVDPIVMCEVYTDLSLLAAKGKKV